MENNEYKQITGIFSLRTIANKAGIQRDKLRNNLMGAYNSLSVVEKNNIFKAVRPAIESICNYLGYDIQFIKKGR